MSLDRRPIAPIPEETARVARAAFPKGHRYMTMRDVLGVLYTDGHFSSLAWQPPCWRCPHIGSALFAWCASSPRLASVLSWCAKGVPHARMPRTRWHGTCPATRACVHRRSAPPAVPRRGTASPWYQHEGHSVPPRLAQGEGRRRALSGQRSCRTGTIRPARNTLRESCQTSAMCRTMPRRSP